MSSLIVLHNVCTVQLTSGHRTLVDKDDYLDVSKLTWCPETKKNGDIYAVRTGWNDGKQVNVRLSRWLINAPEGMIVDHFNGDTLDNRRVNLRLCTTLQNSRNRHKTHGVSRFKGVKYSNQSSINPWIARICVNRHRIHLGCFSTEEEAAKAYDVAAIKHYGEYAATNSRFFGLDDPTSPP